MTAFWATVLSVLTVYWYVRAGRWARGVDRERRKTHKEMNAELQVFIVQIETGKGPQDPGSGMSGDRV